MGGSVGSRERVGPRPFNPNPSLFALACPKWSPAGGTMVVRAREAVGWNFSARKEKGMGKGQLLGLVLTLDAGFLALTQCTS